MMDRLRGRSQTEIGVRLELCHPIASGNRPSAHNSNLTPISLPNAPGNTVIRAEWNGFEDERRFIPAERRSGYGLQGAIAASR